MTIWKILFIFTVYPLSSLGFTTPLHIIVDPGHGGEDHGAVRFSVHESQVALKVSQKLVTFLKKDPRFHVSSTRSIDQFISLKERINIAQKNKGDVLLSIHVNASSNKSAHGIEIYIKNQLPPDEETLFLANKENHGQEMMPDRKPRQNSSISKKNDVQNILNDLSRQHHLRQSYALSHHLLNNWHGPISKRKNALKQAPFYLISESSMPSVLVELGFLSNRRDRLALTSQKFHHRAARNIYKALVKYKERLDKSL